MSSLLSAEIAAACNALGYFNGTKYLKDRYCFETVKELIRHLRRDTKRHEARLLLGEAKVLQQDLLPLLKDHHEDKELFNVLLRLLVNLTHPVLLLFDEQEPTDPHERQLYLSILSHQQGYKLAFIEDSVMSVLAQKLSSLLEIEWTERDEDTNLAIERILILIRNILQVPADLVEEQRADNDASIHDQVLWACHTSGINAIFLYLASTDTEQPFYMHILEILSQMLREQNPAQLATAAAARSVEERRKDEDELIRIRKAEMEARQAKIKQLKGARHSKFGGTYYLKNVKSVSDRDMIYNKPLYNLDKIDFDLNKRKVRTPKNRRPETTEQLERRSAYSIRLFLKEMCVEFLNGAYNSLMFHVKDTLVRQRGQANDESYYLWAMKFFMEFNRHYKFRIELVSETMSVQQFHWVQTQLDRCYEMILALKKARKNWVKRQHLALKAYEELLMTLLAMDKCGDEDVRASAKVIKSNIFYVMEYRQMSQSLLQSFDPTKLPLNYLRDLMETNHVFLKMLEHFCKSSRMVVQRKKRKNKKKKKNKNKDTEEPIVVVAKKTRDEMWEDGIAEELSVVVQGSPTLPDNLVPYDATLDSTFDEQKIECMRRIQSSLKEKNFETAIGLLKAAIELWPELATMEGVDMSTDEQFIALKDIFFAQLPDSPLDEEEPQPTADQSGEEDSDAESEGDREDRVTEIIEQDFNFEEFMMKFVHPRVMAACGLVVRDFDKPNVTHSQVHAAVKLMHRICVDCKSPAMAFQASLFRTFQRAMRAQKLGGTAALNSKELAQFAAFIMQNFAKVSCTNPHVYIELLFWKTAREAYDICSGYGSYEDSHKLYKGAWTEEQEDELTRLHLELRTKMENEEGSVDEKKLVDEIWDNLIDNTRRSRMAVLKKCKELGFIQNYKKGGKKLWSDDEVEQLANLYEEFKDMHDPALSIKNMLSTSRSKNAIKKKLMEIGVVRDVNDLKCKKGKRKAKSSGNGHESSSSEDSGNSSDDDDREEKEERGNRQVFDQAKAMQALQLVMTDGMSSSIRWLMTSISDTLDDRNSGEIEPVPLVPILEDDCNALEDPTFLNLLASLGMAEPIEGQEQYWRIPEELSITQLLSQTEMLAKALDGRLQSLIEALPVTDPVPQTHTRRVNRTRLDSDSDNSDIETALQRQTSTQMTPDSKSKRRNSPISINSNSESDSTENSRQLKKKKKTVTSSNSDSEGKKTSAKKQKKILRPVDSSDDESMTNGNHQEMEIASQSRHRIEDSSDDEVPIVTNRNDSTQGNQSRHRIADSSDEDEAVVTNGKPQSTQNDKSHQRIADSSDDDELSLVIDDGKASEVNNQSRKRMRESSDEDERVVVKKFSSNEGENNTEEESIKDPIVDKPSRRHNVIDDDDDD